MRGGTRLAALAALLWLALAGLPAAAAGPCEPVTHEGARYTVCRIDLRRFRLELFLNGRSGEPYGSLTNLVRAPEGRGLVMAMNAGMYQADLKPVGLYVADGRTLKEANQAPGPGNFHMKPNGVFYVDRGRAGVAETAAYLKRRLKPSLATQSGPMLLIDGQLHPKFSADGESKKIRNGVGVGADPQVATFAISDELVSFGAFARLFRDALGARNALYLDGSVSALFAPGIGRDDLSFRPLGPILGALPR